MPRSRHWLFSDEPGVFPGPCLLEEVLVEINQALSRQYGKDAVRTQNREQLMGPEGVGEGSTEEKRAGSWIDCKEEILCTKVKKRHEMV